MKILKGRKLMLSLLRFDFFIFLPKLIGRWLENSIKSLWQRVGNKGTALVHLLKGQEEERLMVALIYKCTGGLGH